MTTGDAIALRDVTEEDLPILYEHQADPEAVKMGEYRVRDWDAFLAHWRRLLADPSNVKKAIVLDGELIGIVQAFTYEGRREVGYLLGRKHWGRGLATLALRRLLEIETTRPLFGHVVAHNVASIRVLEKCGFSLQSRDGDGLTLRLG